MNAFATLSFSTLLLAALALAQGRGGGLPPPRAGPGDDPARGDRDMQDEEELALTYFRTCDYDGSGWISFDEAKGSLRLDRKAFAVYDVDIDGRISRTEFTDRYRAVKARGGAFTPPVAHVEARNVPQRSPAELVDAFDTDKDDALDAREIARALDEYRAHGVEADRVLESVDRDQSKKVEVVEAQALLDVLVPPAASLSRKARAATVEELFDRVEPRAAGRDQTMQPDRIVGPLSTFRRLDYDQSGGISVEDLEQLQRPMHLPVRIRALVAALDTDGDGVLSAAELRAALE